VAEPGERDRVVVLRDNEVLVLRVVDGRLVEQVRVRAQAGELELGLDAALVDGHELLVQMVEGRAGGAQPVLEHRDVSRVAVRRVQVGHRLHGEGQVPRVLLRRERARPREVGVGLGAVGEVPPGDDDVVAAREEAAGELVALGVAE
jgi:hypothetical protein